MKPIEGGKFMSLLQFIEESKYFFFICITFKIN